MLSHLALVLLAAKSPLTPLVTPRPLEQSRHLKQRPAAVGKQRGDATAIYKKVAPSTVLVRLDSSFGSGVVISKDGLVLTNHHVVVRGKLDNLAVTVTVTRGQLDANGVMERLDTPLTARVLAWNEEADVALLKLDQPPDDLAFSPLAARGVTPGAAVFAMGHGGIGLMWSLRVCNATAVGGDKET